MTVKTAHEARWYSEFLASYIINVAIGEGSIQERCANAFNDCWMRSEDFSQMEALAYAELEEAFSLIKSDVPDIFTSGYNEEISEGFRKLNNVECMIFLMKIQRAREILVAKLGGEEVLA